MVDLPDLLQDLTYLRHLLIAVNEQVVLYDRRRKIPEAAVRLMRSVGQRLGEMADAAECERHD